MEKANTVSPAPSPSASGQSLSPMSLEPSPAAAVSPHVRTSSLTVAPEKRAQAASEALARHFACLDRGSSSLAFFNKALYFQLKDEGAFFAYLKTSEIIAPMCQSTGADVDKNARETMSITQLRLLERYEAVEAEYDKKLKEFKEAQAKTVVPMSDVASS